jgi:D-alanyl-D-alanine carboxypeptidase
MPSVFAQPFIRSIAFLLVSATLLLSACGSNDGSNGAALQPADLTPEQTAAAGAPIPEPPVPEQPGPSGGQAAPPEEADKAEADVPVKPEYTVPENSYEAVEVVAEPASITVLVNKKYALPKEYVPDDLVEPDVPFIFKEKLEKRKMRKEAAEALEALFAAAKEDGILLAGVSGYRSYETQKGLYNTYVKRDGQAAADRYSARPGHSEHSTGLAMDVSGIDGKCAATDCFANTPEAKWLAEHVYDYGFIIRYPEGKEDITGYKYEPWHLRYVGVDAAREIRDLGVTLEEYIAMKGAAVAAGSSGDAEGGASAGAEAGESGSSSAAGDSGATGADLTRGDAAGAGGAASGGADFAPAAGDSASRTGETPDSGPDETAPPASSGMNAAGTQGAGFTGSAGAEAGASEPSAAANVSGEPGPIERPGTPHAPESRTESGDDGAAAER